MADEEITAHHLNISPAQQDVRAANPDADTYDDRTNLYRAARIRMVEADELAQEKS